MDRLIEQLKRHEGVETHAYDDTGAPVDCLGKITLGVGRNIDPRGGIGLSMDEIEYLLSNDILRCIKELSTEYPWFGDLDEVRQEAIINIFFNLGATRFRGFKRALAAMENGDYARASVEFLDSRWAKQVGGRALELTDIIRSGEYV
jgi:lysozyme